MQRDVFRVVPLDSHDRKYAYLIRRRSHDAHTHRAIDLRSLRVFSDPANDRISLERRNDQQYDLEVFLYRREASPYRVAKRVLCRHVRRA